MKRTRFLIGSLLAAGFGAQHDASLIALAKATTPTGGDDPNQGKLLRLFSQDHTVTLAGHSSHSSHSSHASHSSGYGGGGHFSHTSHRSSSGGGGYNNYGGTYDDVPAAAAPPSPPPRAQPLFTPQTRAPAPPADGLPALSGRTKRFTAIVKRVQIALLAQDCYTGAIDGSVSPILRKSLRKFQGARGIEVTGTITPATLNALMVSSE